MLASAFREVFLQPGEFQFGGSDMRMRTLLGSCVSVVVWHPVRRLGGMCHFMLPSRTGSASRVLDGRYADEAMEWLLINIHRYGTQPGDYQLKLFGGGNMFPDLRLGSACHIGIKNVQKARELSQRYGFKCVSEHVEGMGHRYLIFDVWNGVVSMRHQSLPHSRTGSLDK